jgi:hypothetical protein
MSPHRHIHSFCSFFVRSNFFFDSYDYECASKVAPINQWNKIKTQFISHGLWSNFFRFLINKCYSEWFKSIEQILNVVFKYKPKSNAGLHDIFTNDILSF